MHFIIIFFIVPIVVVAAVLAAYAFAFVVVLGAVFLVAEWLWLHGGRTIYLAVSGVVRSARTRA